MDENHIVTKSNNLIEARYKLTLEEQRLILCLVSMIQPMDEDFKVYAISVKEFLSIVNIKNQNIYPQFKMISEHLLSKPLTIKKENSTLIMNWLSSAEYYSGQGKIELSFDPKLKPYLLKLKDNFTSYKLKNVITLKSFYSIRIYELLKQYERLGERTLSLKDLRDYLNVEKDFYPMYSNFKQKVLNAAYRELKAKADIYFEYEELKLNRKVDKLRFIIYTRDSVPDKGSSGTPSNVRPLLPPEIKDDIDALRRIIGQPLTDRELLSIYKAAEGDMALIERRYGEARDKRKLENIVGFMVWACREPDERFKKTAYKGQKKVNNFEGRKLDYAALEKLERELLAQELAEQGIIPTDDSTL